MADHHHRHNISKSLEFVGKRVHSPTWIQEMPSHLKNNTYHQSLDSKQEYASPRCVRRPPCCKKVWRSPLLRTSLVDPVWCLRKVDPRYSWPDHGTFVLGSADELTTKGVPKVLTE